MTTAPRESRVHDALWRGAPVVLTVLLALGYLIGVALVDEVSEHLPQPWLPAILILAQAAALLVRYRAPLAALLAVAALDAVTLLISSGELGTGTFAAMVAVYSYTRQQRTTRSYLVTGGLAAVFVVITFIAVQTSDEVPAAWALPFAVLRNVLTFGAPILVAEIVVGRARLIEALRERADAAERERERRAEEAVQRERALMARELHDIAAHHLTGIIVSAQAADALRVVDPDRAGEYIRQVQKDARTTLDNLRQTVGLLRAGEEGELAPLPSIEQLPALVADASSVGSPVQFTESGMPRDIGPLAGIAAYRMVQESLANSLRHAPGAQRSVEVVYRPRSLLVTVRNGPAAPAPRNAEREGYGLLGMAERAELIGATLSTGTTADGGWANTLDIPYDGARS